MADADELRRLVEAVLDPTRKSETSAGHKLLAEGCLALLDERDRLRTAIENACGDLAHGFPDLASRCLREALGLSPDAESAAAPPEGE